MGLPRQWSLNGFNEIYDQLDIRFDRYYFNSMAEHPGKEVVNELIAKGIDPGAERKAKKAAGSDTFKAVALKFMEGKKAELADILVGTLAELNVLQAD